MGDSRLYAAKVGAVPEGYRAIPASPCMQIAEMLGALAAGIHQVHGSAVCKEGILKLEGKVIGCQKGVSGCFEEFSQIASSLPVFCPFSGRFLGVFRAKMITCRKNCFEQLIFELHRITVHPFLFARINFRL